MIGLDLENGVWSKWRQNKLQHTNMHGTIPDDLSGEMKLTEYVFTYLLLFLVKAATPYPHCSYKFLKAMNTIPYEETIKYEDFI